MSRPVITWAAGQRGHVGEHNKLSDHLNAFYYPQDFGDIGGIDDRPAIQAAIDAAYSAGGGTVLLHNPLYTIICDSAARPGDEGNERKGLQLKSNVHLVSFCQSVIQLMEDSALASYNPVLWAEFASNFSIEGVIIDANGQNQTGAVGIRTGGLEMKDCSDVIIDRCTFKNGLTATGFSGGNGISSWNGSNDRVRVSNCHFEGNGQSDIGLFWGSDWVIVNCTSKDTGYMPINIETGGGATIRRVTVSNWAADTCNASLISAIQNAGGICEDVLVENVVGYNVHDDLPASIGGVRVRGTKRVTLRGIKIYGCKSKPLYVTVDSNLPVDSLYVEDFEATALSGTGESGVSLAGSAAYPITRATLRDVRIDTPVDYGLVATYTPDLVLQNCRFNNSGNSGINLSFADRAQVVACRVREAGNDAAGSFYGIAVHTSVGFQITNCHVTDGMSIGISVDGASDQFQIHGNQSYDDQVSKTQTYGIYITTTVLAPTWSAVNNQLRSNASGSLFHDTADTSHVVNTANNT